MDSHIKYQELASGNSFCSASFQNMLCFLKRLMQSLYSCFISSSLPCALSASAFREYLRNSSSLSPAEGDMLQSVMAHSF